MAPDKVKIDVDYSTMEGNDPKVLEKALTIFSNLDYADTFTAICKKAKPVYANMQRIICEMVVEKEHINGKGTLHGGMTATLTDTITSRAVQLHTSKPRASIELSVSYMLPVTMGDTIVITADILKVGLNIAFAEAEFRRKSDGRIIAKGKHTMAIIHNM